MHEYEGFKNPLDASEHVASLPDASVELSGEMVDGPVCDECGKQIFSASSHRSSCSSYPLGGLPDVLKRRISHADAGRTFTKTHDAETTDVQVGPTVVEQLAGQLKDAEDENNKRLAALAQMGVQVGGLESVRLMVLAEELLGGLDSEGRLVFEIKVQAKLAEQFINVLSQARQQMLLQGVNGAKLQR
jgi:hypothetical protein